MQWTWQQTVAPTMLAVTLAEVKDHCNVQHGAKDEYLQTLIEAATRWVEEYTRRALPTQTWQVQIEGFVPRLWLPRAAPFASMTSVTYYDSSNASQTLASSVYSVHTGTDPASVTLAIDQTWPDTASRPDAVTWTYVAGWSDRALIPAPLRHAIKLLAGSWWMYREEQTELLLRRIPMGVEALCAPFRVFVKDPEGV